MRKDAVLRKIEALEELRGSLPDDATLATLAKALDDSSNHVVAKAAKLITAMQSRSLIPALLRAYERFFENPTVTDRQCAAKIAIARALDELGYAEPEPFLRGLDHVQMEASYGPPVDTGEGLRRVCALALPRTSISDIDLLRRLVARIADKETAVRIDALRATGLLQCDAAELLLRLKASLGDSDPRVTGQALASLLAVTGGRALGFVANFLYDGDADVAMEAAAALSEAKDGAAVDALTGFYRGQFEPAAKQAVIRLIGASPLESAARFLVELVKDGSPTTTSLWALDALASSRFRSRLREQVEAAVRETGSSRLLDVFRREFRD